MKRDWDLIRKILLAAEALPPGEVFEVEEQEFEGYHERIVEEHVALMIEAGLLHGWMNRNPDFPVRGFVLTSLTWAGHDFLDNARNDVLWRRAMKQAAKAGAGLSVSVLGDLLTALGRGALNL